MRGSPETGGRRRARKNVNVRLRPDSGIKESVGWKRQGLEATGVRGGGEEPEEAGPETTELAQQPGSLHSQVEFWIWQGSEV